MKIIKTTKTSGPLGKATRKASAKFGKIMLGAVDKIMQPQKMFSKVPKKR